MRYGDNDVYWIDASIIPDLKETVFSKVWAAEIIREELQVNGVPAATVALNEFQATGEQTYVFSLFELLDICEFLIEADRAEEAEVWYSALLESFDAFRVQYGYARSGCVGFSQVCIIGQGVSVREVDDFPPFI